MNFAPAVLVGSLKSVTDVSKHKHSSFDLTLSHRYKSAYRGTTAIDGSREYDRVNGEGDFRSLCASSGVSPCRSIDLRVTVGEFDRQFAGNREAGRFDGGERACPAFEGRHRCLLRRFPLRGPCDRLGQILRQLRPADGELAVEDEHRHALDAGLLCLLHLLLDLGDSLIAG